MDAISSAIISKALDGLSVRQNFIAQNLANANSPGYRPVEVTFENSLKAAASKGLQAIENTQVKTRYAVTAETSEGTRLDMDLAIAAQTSMRYSGLIEVMDRQMSLMRTVIKGGQ